jgi:spermidine/putrescine transport system ATP-binding protein
MSQEVALEGVTRRFGEFTAVRNVDLTIRAGEFFSFLGPSGCGKTTILRMISGFIEPSEGVVRIGGKDMRGIGPNKRPTALIFQNLALFPLMPVWQNVAFGLEVRGVGKAERRKRAEELLAVVELAEAADKQVAQLSGGQRQRVAIARALAVEPQVMLLDEPLSALDLKLRQYMRAELRRIQQRTGVTFIYITHDQGEALTMSDRVGVMSQGVLQQVGTPLEIYNDPATPFVASFVGEANVFNGRVTYANGTLAQIETERGIFSARLGRGARSGEPAMLFVRPEHMRLGEAAAGTGNRLSGAFNRAEFEGSFVNVFCDGGLRKPMVSQMRSEPGLLGLRPGETLPLGFDPSDAVILPLGDLARE